MTRARAEMPSLMHVGLWLSGLAGALFLVMLPLAAVDTGSFSIGSEPVSGPEFLRHAGLAVGLLGALLLAVAYGFWQRRSWSRHVVMAFHLYSAGAALMLATGAEAVAVALQSALLFLVAGWYFYGKANVVAYFRHLRAVEAGEGRHGVPSPDA